MLLPYPGVLEILIAAPLAKLTGRKIILDAFLPLYDTIVGDRALVGREFLARVIWLFEKMGLNLADIVLVDTDSHGDYFASEFGLARERFHTVLVGAEPLFDPQKPLLSTGDILTEEDTRPIILFYGQLIPLHGVPTIIEAARLYQGPDAHWVIIGRGQLEPEVERILAECGDELAARLTWIKWVDYEKLPSIIARATLCLGVFGASDKAARVIPNKLFQQAAMGKRVITRASPAVDPLARRYPETVLTVTADNARALAERVAETLSDNRIRATLPDDAIHEISPDPGVAQLLHKLSAKDV